MPNTTEHKIQVKLALAKKYERLCLLAGSIPKRKTLKYRADRFRRQAQAMSQAQKSATERN